MTVFLSRPLVSFELGGGFKSNAPLISVSVGLDGKWARPVTALVDTGASATLAHLEIGESLGLPSSTIEARPAIDLVGAGGAGIKGYHYEVSIRFFKGSAIDAPEARYSVFFTRQPMLFPVVLGQLDCLEKLTLVHRNHGHAPMFFLKDP